jgi:hypothetical protein
LLSRRNEDGDGGRGREARFGHGGDVKSPVMAAIIELYETEGPEQVDRPSAGQDEG